jgi:hypothetical protein
MHQWIRRQTATLVLFGLACVGIAGLSVRAVDSGSSVREIVLVIRDMAFYIEGQTTPNPKLRFKANEDVRIVLRNVESGMLHGFSSDSLDVSVAGLGAGQVGSVEFRVPSNLGIHEYICTPHSAMMRGVIEIIETE